MNIDNNNYRKYASLFVFFCIGIILCDHQYVSQQYVFLACLSLFMCMILNATIILQNIKIFTAIFILGYFMPIIHHHPVIKGVIFASGNIQNINENKIFMNNIQYVTIGNQNTRNLNKLLLNYNKCHNLQPNTNIKFVAYLNSTNRGKLIKYYNNNRNIIMPTRKNKYIDLIRNRIINFCLRSKSHNDFLQAILTGNRIYLSEERIQNLQRSNMYHLLALSGLHINLIMLIFHKIFSSIMNKLHIFNFGRKYNVEINIITAILTAIIGYGYIIISYNPASAYRAFIMNLFIIFMPYPHNRLNVLVLTMFIMTLLSPNIIFDLGFQLSSLCSFILISNRSMIGMNLMLAPIVKHLNFMTIMLNPIILSIFSIILSTAMLASIFNIVFYIPILEKLIDIIYYISDFCATFATININNNPILNFYYILLIIMTFVTNKYIFLYFGMLVIIIFNLCAIYK